MGPRIPKCGCGGDVIRGGMLPLSHLFFHPVTSLCIAPSRLGERASEPGEARSARRRRARDSRLLELGQESKIGIDSDSTVYTAYFEKSSQATGYPLFFLFSSVSARQHRKFSLLNSVHGEEGDRFSHPDAGKKWCAGATAVFLRNHWR